MQANSIMGRPLDSSDVASAAQKLNVTEPHVRAVIAVEASGSGFLGKYENDPRLPKILFEAHVFRRETGGQFDTSHPGLSSPNWNRALYAGGIAEHDRLRQARELDFAAAYRSTSWGLFQIMGFNHEAAGYDVLYDFVGAQYVSEGLQLQCGVRFILAQGLDKYLRAEDWSAFARGYNGPEYEQNRYHEKLAGAFERYKSGTPQRGQGVEDVQRALNRFGFNLAVDGVPGSRTEAAIREFQERKGLTVDGIAGPDTRRALALQ
jgi:N-acetylmuramidase/Putative peptidoglycan binding domain